MIVLYVQQQIVKEFKLISRNKCEKLTAAHVNILHLDYSINLKDVWIKPFGTFHMEAINNNVLHSKYGILNYD